MTALPPPFPSFTKAWHNTTYPAISPKRPELSSKGRSVLITGGGTGIGAAVAHGFAAAGSREIALLGRTQKTLSETADVLKKEFPDITVTTQIADVTNQKSINAAFDAVLKLFGKIDVCVSNAAGPSVVGPVADADPDEWMNGFDTIVKGSLLVVQAFLRNAKDGSSLIHTSTGYAHLGPILGPVSGYAASKAASTKLFEYVAAEHPGIFVANVQPGIVKTGLGKSSGASPDLDDINLPSHFYVWLASPEASFLRGKFVWANWDVDELKARKEEIQKTELLDTGLNGISTIGWDISAFLAHNRA